MKKKILALVLGATMILGSTLSVCAADVEAEAEATNAAAALESAGELEGWLGKDVFKVTLPTTSAAGIKMTLDPQGLLNKVDASKYATAAGAVYFAGNTDNTKSADIVIKNKSSFKVDVKLDVTVTTGDKITLVDAATALATATDPSLYLEITDDASPTPNVTTLGATTTVTTTLDPITYEIKTANSATTGYVESKTESGKFYAYLPANASASKDVTYNISGSCDDGTKADWSGATAATPTIGVVWTVTEHSDDAAPSITTSNVDVAALAANATASIPVSLGSGTLAATGITSCTVLWTDSKTYPVACTYDSATSSIIVPAKAVSDVKSTAANTAITFTVKFNDTAATTATFTLTNK